MLSIGGRRELSSGSGARTDLGSSGGLGVVRGRGGLCAFVPCSLPEREKCLFFTQMNRHSGDLWRGGRCSRPTFQLGFCTAAHGDSRAEGRWLALHLWGTQSPCPPAALPHPQAPELSPARASQTHRPSPPLPCSPSLWAMQGTPHPAHSALPPSGFPTFSWTGEGFRCGVGVPFSAQEPR